MGLYRLYTGTDGESHIEELKPAEQQALRQIQPHETPSPSRSRRGEGRA